MSAAALREIEREVPDCTRCPRLVAHLEQLRKRYPDYWCRPVPGFGDRGAWLVIVGLAPGLHGANRSGRPFCMDASGEWLYPALEQLDLWDGRKLSGAYILNAVKCVPPGNRPIAAELSQCRPWLAQELAALTNARVVLALGAIAHTSVLKVWGARPLARYPFAHGALHRIQDRPPLLSSYHPSRQNTNTGVLTRPMWRYVFRRALKLGAVGP
ncbi:MAG: uracil-DNA glycosylase [Deltaproteobacteria bacterium]|nr:uracil-DNA glycosylase [Deltaproteobacteria bacterium]